MKRILPGLLTLATFAHAAEFHVSPTGNDTNPGTVAQPFATLEKARDAARGEKGSTIQLATGTYRLTKTFELGPQDSGTIIRAVNGADVRLSGSVAAPNKSIKTVTDPAVLERLLPEVRGKVMEITVPNFRPEEFGEIGPRGFRRPYVPAPLEVFIEDEPLTLSRWPNPGQPGEPIGKVLDRGPITRKGEKPTRGGTFHYKTDLPVRWTKATDVWITGLFDNGYADNTVQVKSFDLEKKTLTTVQPHMYGFSSGKPWNRWIALNLLEEIDLPGEYAIDRAAGKVYFLPPADKDLGKSRIEVSRLSAPMIALEGATGVVIDGITLENSRGMGVYIERGANNRIRNCTLRNLGMVAVSIGKGIAADANYRHSVTGAPVSRELGSWHEHIYDNPAFDREAGTGHGIVNCQIYNIGAGAISLGGGNRMTLTPAGNFVENCDIHHFNRWDRTYKGAVNLDGVGNRISHCDIHDAPAVAIYLHGNDHVIEYNRIHDVVKEADEIGAFYMGRDPSERGNILRHNFFYHIGQWEKPITSGHGTVALHFDDCSGNGTQVFGNIFWHAGSNSAFILGTDVTVKNNLILDCHYLQNPYNRAEYAGDGRKGGIFYKRLHAVKFDQSPWKEHYPGFETFLDRIATDPRENLVANNLIVTRSILPPSKAKAPTLLRLENNRFEKSIPDLFVDPAKGNFTLKPGADIGISGFDPIPFEKIGRLDGKRLGKP
jgi:parallel beta-helix repeat protein